MVAWEGSIAHKEITMKRTTHRSKKGKKLYAKRNKKGRFVDIQSYKKAHRLDIKRRSKKEGK
jgi:plasmid replication initiation protein